MELEPALLRGVLQAPGEDGPRMVLADWLLEREDPRGSFIADQVRLARLPEIDPGWPALYLRAERALAAELPRILAPLQQHPLEDVVRWHSWGPVVRRGFLEEISLPSDPRALDWLLSWAPLRLARAPASLVPALADRGIPALALRGALSPEQLRTLPLERFAHLDLEESEMGARGAKILAERLAGGPLRCLALRGGHIRDSGVAALASAGVLDQVDTLDLTANLLGPASLDRLLERPSDRPLRLRLSGNILIASQLDRVLGWRPLRALEFRVAPRGEVLDRVLASPALRELQSLCLSSCTDLDAARAAKLAEIPFLRLTRLDLGNARVGAEGAQALAASEHLRHLVSLDLASNQLDDEGLLALLSSPHLTRLVELDVSRCRLTDESARALAQWPHLSGLAALGLDRNGRIEAPGLEALMSAEGFQPLKLGLLDLSRDAYVQQRLAERFGSAVRA